MTYSIWDIQAISGQLQDEPQTHRRSRLSQDGFVRALHDLLAQESAAQPVAAPAPGSPASLVIPYLREVQHVDLGDLSSQKVMHPYIA
ncbi:hypothetical protein LJC60_01930 [Ruminococcaceae bacterium OttesenSCG-928-D13]|nr:hypothetical protein [Ruminococcaceae bacterium OttesenSCG-928-D13]